MKERKGESILEFLIVIGLVAIMLPALLTGLYSSRNGKAQQYQRIQAVALLKEAQDAVKNARNNNWTNISTDGTYHPIADSGAWTLSPSSASINGFTESVVISSVYRDSDNKIVTTGGTLDPSSKKVVISINWETPQSSSVQSTLYFTRYMFNQVHTDTTVTDFNKSVNVQTNAVVIATNPSPFPDDGEVDLASGGYGNWCNPTLEANSLNLNGSASESVMTAYTGHAYTGTGGNASGDSFDNILITTPAAPTPPVASLSGSYDHYKSYGIYADPSYGYITSDHPGITFEIIDLSNNSLVGTGNNNGGAGNSVFVLNHIAYVTSADSKMYLFDLSTAAGSHTPISGTTVNLAGVGQKVLVMGDSTKGYYAYIAINSTTTQLQIVPLGTNGKTPGATVNIGVNGNGARDLTMSSDQKRAYLIAAVSTTKPEFFIIDTDSTSATYKQTKGTYDTLSHGAMDPSAIAIVPGNKALIGGTGGETYQALDISAENAPVHCGGVTTSFAIRAFAPVINGGDVYTYVLAGTDPEFRIIQGGSGGSYATSGTYESPVFDSGAQTANNRFSSTFSTPPGTSIQFQVSMAAATGSPAVCPTSGYTYLGLDGNPATRTTLTSGQYVTFPFTTNGTYVNPGRCFRYKVYFSTTNQTSTPFLNDVSINYSP
jgi:type II secretory pathway pseudopilin PulG